MKREISLVLPPETSRGGVAFGVETTGAPKTPAVRGGNRSCAPRPACCCCEFRIDEHEPDQEDDAGTDRESSQSPLACETLQSSRSREIRRNSRMLFRRTPAFSE